MRTVIFAPLQRLLQATGHSLAYSRQIRHVFHYPVRWDRAARGKKAFRFKSCSQLRNFGFVVLLVMLACFVYAPRAADARAAQRTIQQPWPVIGLSALPQIFTEPVFITHDGVHPDRLYVVEKGGRIYIVENGVLMQPPFLDFGEPGSAENPVAHHGENGLLSVAFAPDFATSGYFFVYYNSRSDRVRPPSESDVTGRTKEENFGRDSVIARFRVQQDDPNQADMDSEETIMEVNQPYDNHNGGQLAFGPDGYLYIGLGDGGSAGDPIEAGQRLDTLLGKLLRIDVSAYDGPDSYAIPAGNPFASVLVAGQNVRPEIWAYGLRNPWRYSFDRTTGDLYIGDVGQNVWEEINFQPAQSSGAENYGWDVIEGPDCYYDEHDDDTQPCERSGKLSPILTYDHSQGCSVTGGYVFRGIGSPFLEGVYLFGDYCTGRIWGARQVNNEWESQELLNTDLWLASFGEDYAGNVYAVDMVTGIIYRVIDSTQKRYLPIIGS